MIVFAERPVRITIHVSLKKNHQVFLKSLEFFKKKREEEDGDVARSNARGRLELTSTRTGLFKRGEIFMIF